MIHILICDDEDITCSHIEKVLVDYAEKEDVKVSVDVCYTGEGVLNYMKQGDIVDLLFLDIELPGMNGAKVGNMLRVELGNETVQIVYISSQDKYAMQLFQIRTFDFLIKPLNADMGFNSSQTEDFMMIDMNRVLNKYDITTTERLRHFFAQCFVESGNIVGLPIEKDNQAGTHLKSQSYYQYYGVGHIQMTHIYSYQSFAIYVALEKYPELKNGVKYLSPAHNGPDLIQTQYDKLKEEAKDLGIDISEIVKIVEPPEDAPQYVAENYEWETAGYFWEVGEANRIVDSLVPGDDGEVDKITYVVNSGTPTYQERRDAYRNNVKGVIQ